MQIVVIPPHHAQLRGVGAEQAPVQERGSILPLVVVGVLVVLVLYPRG